MASFSQADHQAKFELITSLRQDPVLLESSENTLLSGQEGTPTKFYMFEYHRDRLLAAAEFFRWEAVVSKLQGPRGLDYLYHDLVAEVDRWQSREGVSMPLKVGETGNLHY